MKKYVQIFSNGTINYTFNFSLDVKKLKIFEKDHINFHLNKKHTPDIIQNFSYSVKYKNKYLV